MRDAELRARVEAFRLALRSSGLKVTPQRLEIFREAARSEDHPDVEAIYRGVRKRVPTISLDTVYRTLRVFLDHGLIVSRGTDEDRLRLDANSHPHHHFVCRRCGLTRDVAAGEIGPLPIPPAAAAWGSVEQASIEFRGLCSACAAGRPSKAIRYRRVNNKGGVKE